MEAKKPTFEVFTLKNNQSNEVRLLNYGATLQGLTLIDPDGNPLDIVLGYDRLEDYASEDRNYFGATIGRIAGRLSGGGFPCDNSFYTVEKNHGPYHLHGGSKAMSHQFWKGAYQRKEEGDQVTFQYHSVDGENGYPGDVNVEVTYQWSNDNCLQITIEATTNKITPLAMTNHAYFNLNGGDGSAIKNHHIQIFADTKVGVHPDLGHTGEQLAVAGTPDDFQSPTLLENRLAAIHKSHGAMYCLSQKESFEKRAQLWSEKKGLKMEVWTNQNFLQFYTGEHLNAIPGKNSVVYGPFSGACFECQGYPDAPNFPEMTDIFLHPGERYFNQTAYRFHWM